MYGRDVSSGCQLPPSVGVMDEEANRIVSEFGKGDDDAHNERAAVLDQSPPPPRSWSTRTKSLLLRRSMPLLKAFGRSTAGHKSGRNALGSSHALSAGSHECEELQSSGGAKAVLGRSSSNEELDILPSHLSSTTAPSRSTDCVSQSANVAPGAPETPMVPIQEVTGTVEDEGDMYDSPSHKSPRQGTTEHSSRPVPSRHFRKIASAPAMQALFHADYPDPSTHASIDSRLYLIAREVAEGSLRLRPAHSESNSAGSSDYSTQPSIFSPTATPLETTSSEDVPVLPPGEPKLRSILKSATTMSSLHSTARNDSRLSLSSTKKTTRFSLPGSSLVHRPECPSQSQNLSMPDYDVRSESPFREDVSQVIVRTRLPGVHMVTNYIKRLDGIEVAGNIELADQDVDGISGPEIRAEENGNLTTLPGTGGHHLSSTTQLPTAVDPLPQPIYVLPRIRIIRPPLITEDKSFRPLHSAVIPPSRFMQVKAEVTNAVWAIARMIGGRIRPQDAGPKAKLIPDPVIKRPGLIPESAVVGPSAYQLADLPSNGKRSSLVGPAEIDDLHNNQTDMRTSHLWDNVWWPEAPDYLDEVADPEPCDVHNDEHLSAPGPHINGRAGSSTDPDAVLSWYRENEPGVPTLRFGSLHGMRGLR